MSEWTTGEVWTTGPTLTIKVEGETVYEGEKLPAAEAKRKIIEAARQKGLAKFIVKVNGETVTPADFPAKYEAAETVEIEVFKADYAG